MEPSSMVALAAVEAAAEGAAAADVAAVADLSVSAAAEGDAVSNESFCRYTLYRGCEETNEMVNIRGAPSSTDVFYDASRSSGFSTFNLHMRLVHNTSPHPLTGLKKSETAPCLSLLRGSVDNQPITEPLLCVEHVVVNAVGQKRSRGRQPRHVLGVPTAVLPAQEYGGEVFFSFSIRRVSSAFGGYRLLVKFGDLQWTSAVFRVISYRLNPIYSRVNQTGAERVLHSCQVLEKCIERFHEEHKLQEHEVRVLLKALGVHAKIRVLDYKRNKRAAGAIGFDELLESSGRCVFSREEKLLQCFKNIVQEEQEEQLKPV